MKHRKNADFDKAYSRLPLRIQHLADKCFEKLRENPPRPSVRLKRVGLSWAARVDKNYRMTGTMSDDGESIEWFDVDTHKKRDKLLRRR